MKSAEYGKLNLLAPENVRLGSIRIRLCIGNEFSMLNGIIKAAFAGKNCRPAFVITVLYVPSVEEEMGDVINRVKAEIFAGLNQREVESRDIRTAFCNVEERGVPVYYIFSDFLLELLNANSLLEANLMSDSLNREKRPPAALDRSPDGRSAVT